MSDIANPDKSHHLIKTESLIANVLRYGVLICIFIVTVGLFFQMSRIFRQGGSSHTIETLMQGQLIPDYHPARTAHQFAQGFLNHDSNILITFGLLLLIALPVTRVALTVFIFLFERDWPFVLITAVVLSILMSSLILGKSL